MNPELDRIIPNEYTVKWLLVKANPRYLKISCNNKRTKLIIISRLYTVIASTKINEINQ